MDNKYGGVIWTNHALQRLRERGIKQGDAWATWKRPDSSKYEDETWVYRRNYNNKNIEVVAKKNERGEWIILSVWSRPVYENKKSRSKNQGFLSKLFRFLF